MPDSSVLVACLCAEWCSVCRDYESVFRQVESALPQARFLWVDIEEQSDLVDPIEIDDFPTVLVAVGDSVRFFGPLAARAERLERLVREQAQSPHAGAAGPGNVAPEVQDLLARLRPLRKA